MNAGVIIKKEIVNASKTMVIVGVLAIVLGVIALIYPSAVGEISTVVVGIFLVLGGGFRLLFAIVSKTIGSMLLRYLFALLMVIAGFWIISNPDMGLEILTMIIAIYFIVDGVTSVFFSISLKPIGGGMHMLISGILSALLGIMIYSKWPESSEYVLGIYLGIKFILDGAMLALTGSAIKKVNKQ